MESALPLNSVSRNSTNSQDPPATNSAASPLAVSNFSGQLRFVHAAQLRLDHPWQGIGRIPSELLPIVEQASMTAWEFIQRQCYELQVDFVLLTGNTLVAADYPLAGEASLIKGLQHLHDLNIPVYLIPGELDPEHYWDAIDHRLPPNTHRLSSHDPIAHTVTRDGLPIATLLPLAGPPASAPENWIDPDYWDTWQDQLIDRDAPFPIALVHQTPSDQFPNYDTLPAPVEQLLRTGRIRYFASGATLHRWSRSFGSALWHVPGTPSPLRASLSDSVGCSLVEVDATGQVTTRLLPTSPVRREKFNFPVTPLTTRTDLIDQLSHQLSKTTIARDQNLCWIDLVIQGAGPLTEELLDAEACKQLRADILEYTSVDQVPLWVDRIDFHETRSNTELIAGSSRMTGDFLQQLDYLCETSAEQETSLLEQLPAPEGFPDSTWQNLRRDIELSHVIAATRSLGAQLLGTRREVVDEDH